MSATNVQFTVAAHIMAALGFRHGEETPSAMLAESINADPTFVRKSLSKLSKAGLIVTTRGKDGASKLTRSPKHITLLDIYRASAAPPRHHRRWQSNWPAQRAQSALHGSAIRPIHRW